MVCLRLMAPFAIGMQAPSCLRVSWETCPAQVNDAEFARYSDRGCRHWLAVRVSAPFSDSSSLVHDEGLIYNNELGLAAVIVDPGDIFAWWRMGFEVVSSYSEVLDWECASCDGAEKWGSLVVSSAPPPAAEHFFGKQQQQRTAEGEGVGSHEASEE